LFVKRPREFEWFFFFCLWLVDYVCVIF
jgi:hypothetical protein